MLRRNLYSFIFIASSSASLMGQDALQWVRHAPYSTTISDYVRALDTAEKNIERLFQIVQYQELNHQRSTLSFESLLAEKAEPFLNKVLGTVLTEMKKDFLAQLEEVKKTCQYNDTPLKDKISSLKSENQESVTTLKRHIEDVTKEYQKMLIEQKKEIELLHELKPSIRHLKTAEIDQKKSMIALKEENTQLHQKIKKLSERLTNQETLFEKRLTVLSQKIESQAEEIKKLKGHQGDKENPKCQVQFNGSGIMEKITINLRPKTPSKEKPQTPIISARIIQKPTEPEAPRALENSASEAQPLREEDSAVCVETNNALMNNLKAHPIVARMSKLENVSPEEYQQFQAILLRHITLYCVNFSLDNNINHEVFTDAIRYLCFIDCSYLKLSFYEYLLKSYVNNPPEVQKNLLLVLKNCLEKRSVSFSKKDETLKISLRETIEILEERKIEHHIFITSLESLDDVLFLKNHFSALLTLCTENKIIHNQCHYLKYLIFCFSLKYYIIFYHQNDSQNNANIPQSLKELMNHMNPENTANAILVILSKSSPLDAMDHEAIKSVFNNLERLSTLNKINPFEAYSIIFNNEILTNDRKEWFLKEIMDKAYSGKTGYKKFRKKCLDS
ncbi:MAG: hypothetical protein CNLJKLNK_00185 [Holosporales bacterium]